MVAAPGEERNEHTPYVHVNVTAVCEATVNMGAADRTVTGADVSQTEMSAVWLSRQERRWGGAVCEVRGQIRENLGAQRVYGQHRCASTLLSLALGPSTSSHTCMKKVNCEV